MKREQLKEVLRLHSLWLDGLDGGERANLSGADLSHTSFRGADLRRANLYHANLRAAYLSGVNLDGAYAIGADLSGANMKNSSIRGADLRNTDLRCADLRGANLSDTDFSGANMVSAELEGADFKGANILGIGNMKQIRSFQLDWWHVAYTHDTLQVGCERHEIEKWRKWNTPAGRKWIEMMDEGAAEWAEKHLGLVLQIIDASPASK